MKRIVEKGLGHLFIISSSSHFFNKTDFEQYLFKKVVWYLTDLLNDCRFCTLSSFVIMLSLQSLIDFNGF